ncbi:MAG: DEAD/DEAH box helicase family protein, partial [Clostridia bacterium]|nr:DEAD/DEAH box helicase family protein [Clostridia bacterium]
MIKPGLYEQIISRAISRELDAVSEDCKHVEKLDAAEAPQALAGYVAEAVRATLEGMSSGSGEQLAQQVNLVNEILSVLAAKRVDIGERFVDERAELLLQVLREDDPQRSVGMTAARVPRPETPMSLSSLFTGAAHEPKMFTELQKEIASADRIDMLVSFIRWSGLRLILDALIGFTERGGILRVITTSYMGATEIKAIDELAALPNTAIKVSYDTTRTRLHAKTYVFFREDGFTTAYVGSSNLSNAAMSNGLEWNLKLTAMDQPDTLRKISATFDSYWNSDEFELYTPESHPRLAEALKGERWKGERQAFLFDIHPYAYQQAILDQLRAEREVRGFFRNLVVAATGTGKTVIAALDYRNWRSAHPKEPNRLLFIAHREEILKQSLMTFQAVLKDPNFGELWVGQYQAEKVDHLFISVQTLNSKCLYKTLP